LDVADARRTYVQAALAEVSAIYAEAQAAATLQEEMGP
jgi:outer membrane protein TolC